MVLTCLVIFCFFLTTVSCRLQCIQETLNDTEFHLNVPEHIEVESIDCIRIPYKVAFPWDQVTVPYAVMLFEGDPSNVVDINEVSNMDFDRDDTFRINELPRGEYEYGIKLEWKCNQTYRYVYPKRIHISVSALTIKPTIRSFPMIEKERTILICQAPLPCFGRVFVAWKLSKANGQATVLDDDNMDYDDYMWYRYINRWRKFLYPTPDHHNANITCLAKYQHDTVETTITLTVKFSPRILNDSYCAVTGAWLVCVCISWGNPLSPITWPSENLTDFSVTSFSSNDQRVRSTLTMSAAKYLNDTVKCISSNELGQAETELLIKNSAEDIELERSIIGFDSALPWITGVCFTLNLVFIAVIIYVIERGRKKHKEQIEEVNNYACLRKAEIEEEYSVISCQTK